MLFIGTQFSNLYTAVDTPARGRVESGWEAGVIKAFDKKGPHAGKFSVKYKDDPNWWTHSLLREGSKL